MELDNWQLDRVIREQKAEIARLQAEVERLNRCLEVNWNARNDALEEAAQECGCLMFSEQQSRYQQWNEACKEAAAAIRAIKT